MSTLENTPDLEIDDYSDFEMPFGRYATQSISDVPTQYLRWMYAKCNFTYFPELQRALESRLGLPPDTIRTGPAAQPEGRGARDEGRAPVAKVAPSNGPLTPRPSLRPETGLDGFQKAFDRTRREALMEYADEPEIMQLIEGVFARVQHALGI